MRRLGLGARLMLLVGLTLFLVQAVLVTTFVAQRNEDTGTGSAMPFPDQVEAMVLALDEESDQERALLLRAFNDDALRVTIEANRPFAEDAGSLIFPRQASLLRDYSDQLKYRDIQMDVAAPRFPYLLPRLRAQADPEEIRLMISLLSGEYLIIQRRSGTAFTLAGVPAGLVSGVIGLVVGLIALLLVWFETRPLRRLSRAAEAFGKTLTPDQLKPAGAADLQTLIASFNEMQSGIARLDSGRTDMIAALAHDIRTPLTRLRLRLNGLDEARLEGVTRDIDEIERITGDAFEFAAADIAEIDQHLDLRSLINAVVDGAQVMLADTTNGKPVNIRGNTALLNRCIDNLVGNALQYGSTCTLTLARTADAARVSVTDDGPGIPPQDRARLLNPFERGERSRNRQTGGIGLGLALAHRIVLRHGGTLTLGDADAGGLRVDMTFPLA